MKITWVTYILILLAVILLAGGVLAGPPSLSILSPASYNQSPPPGILQLGTGSEGEGFQTTPPASSSASSPVRPVSTRRAQSTILSARTLLTELPNNQKGILVHERLLYGYPGQTPIQVKDTEKLIANVYNPFGYAMPLPSASRKNTTRMYRLYVVYSDGMTTEGELKIHICNGSWGKCDKKLTFTANRTWGDTTTGPESWHRDMYTDMKKHEEVSQNHVKIYANTTVKDKTAVIRQITLQAFDVWGGNQGSP
jgi:hypothetical protein